MESKFKVGDRVVWADKQYATTNNSWSVDYVMTVKGMLYDEHEECYLVRMDNGVSSYDFRFKLYKEDPMKQFDMHTQPWFIRVNNEQEFILLQEWLKESFGKAPVSCYEPGFIGVTNTSNNGDVRDWVYFLTKNDIDITKRHEIKLKFKTIIDSVEWPAVESEKDKKIRELKETIEVAARQIKELEECDGIH